jgi:hypothetical protein
VVQFRAVAASAIAAPRRPDDLFPIKRTASIGSCVGPLVTSKRGGVGVCGCGRCMVWVSQMMVDAGDVGTVRGGGRKGVVEGPWGTGVECATVSGAGPLLGQSRVILRLEWRHL